MTDSNYKLLIAEDDVSLRHIVSAFFMKNGFDVDGARSVELRQELGIPVKGLLFVAKKRFSFKKIP